MPEAVHMMKDALSQFHKNPIGPIGIYVQIPSGSERWTSAIEAHIGRELDHFLVHDHHDRERLLAIFRKVFPSSRFPGIIVVNFDSAVKHDIYSSRQAVSSLHPQAILLLDVLKISNETVLKSLIINNGIERVILLEDRDAAIGIMNLAPRPSVIDVIYTLSHQVRAAQRSVSCFPIYQNLTGISLQDDTTTLRFFMT